ncbi:MAG: polysaccharide deacetylase family protein [Candidatus Omnitrophica bacterium]|nr:polysaccharide deacetylase family protein [Candidatus Omnitrophota bacterium]MBU2044547.1 polysaccharide deacetylase family protein [Candidatus Omnitrophota bacterium]MBU2473609.1 polysaccharide deacetylase family protein [Candidatus Omnitrophota bacterium]
MKKILVLIVIFLAMFLSFYVYLNLNYETPILMYHSLDAARVDSYVAVDPKVFSKQMEYIAKHRYKVISLRDYCQALKDGRRLFRKTIVLTFDDGHGDNLVAFPILAELDLPATFFIIVDKLNSPGYLSRAEISQALRNPKISIGSHTITEAYLPGLKGRELSYEVGNSKIVLENLFSRNVETMSYTMGGYDQETLKEVEASGYLCACTTNRGLSKNLDRFALRRIKITNRDLGINLWAKLSGFYNALRKPKKPY